MNLTELSAYFENYAAQHVDLRHTADNPTYFCMNTEDNIDEFLRNNAMDLVFILLVPDDTLKKSWDSYSFDKNTAFLVLSRVSDATNQNKVDAQGNAEIIAKDFITRLINDRHVQISGLEDTITVMPVGPLGDNHFGYITMAKIIDLFDYSVDPTRWTA